MQKKTKVKETKQKANVKNIKIAKRLLTISKLLSELSEKLTK